MAVLVFLGFALYFALMTPAVQTRLVAYFTELLGQRLGTEISIGRVDFRPIESLVLGDVCVKGHSDDTLLYCRRLEMRFDSLSFVKKRATITELDFHGADFKLWVRRDSAGSLTNVEMLLAPLSAKADTLPASPVAWRIALSRIRLFDSRFRYQESQYESRGYGINWTDVDCRNLEVEVSGISFADGVYRADVSGLSFREKSGFRVNRMGGSVVIRDDHMLITSADIRTDKSFIHLDTLEYDWVPDQKYWKYFTTRMRQRYVFSNSSVNFDDLAYFNGALLGMTNVVSGSGVVTGTIDRLRGDHLDLALGDSTRIRGSFRSVGLPPLFDTDFDIILDECVVAPAELERIYMPWLESRYLSFPALVHKLPVYRFRASFVGRLEDFVVEARSLAPQAAGDVRFAYRADSSAYRYDGFLDLYRADYGFWTSAPFLGAGNFRGRFSGAYADSLSSFRLGAMAGHINLFDSHVRGLHLDLSLLDDSLSLAASIDDRRVKASLAASGCLADTSVARFGGSLAVEEWDKIGPSLLGDSETLDLDFSGLWSAFADDSDWKLCLSRFRYANTIDSLSLDSVFLLGKSMGRYRLLRLESPLVDASVGGFFEYDRFGDLWNNIVYNYFPAYEHAVDAVLPVETNLVAQADLKDITPLLRLAWPDIRVSRGVSLSGAYDYASREVRLSASADTLAWGDLYLRDSRIELSGLGKQMDIVCRAAEMAYSSIGRIYNVRNSARIGWNRCDNDLSWSNWHGETYSGNLSASLRLLEYGDRHMAQVNVYPSVIVLADSVWNVERSVILWENKDIFVNNFEIRRGDQCFRLRGRVSEHGRDTLAVEFDKFNLSEFNNILFDNRLSLFGVVQGSVSLRDFYRDRLVYADIAVRDWGLNRDTLGTLRLRSHWDVPSKSLLVHVADSLDGRVPIALAGSYTPSSDSLRMRLALSGVDMRHLSAYFPSAVRSGSGAISGDLGLLRHDRRSVLSGRLALDSVSLLLDDLNTPFLIHDTLSVANNRLLFDGLRVSDADGHPALCSGYYDWDTRRYDLEISLDNFKVLDTPPAFDILFYGRLALSGIARLSNPTGIPELTLILRPGPRSALYLPLSATVEQESGDFLHFVGSPQSSGSDASGSATAAWASRFDLDASLEINNNLEVQLIFDPTIGDILTTVGNGDIKVSVEKNGNLTLFGEYRIEEGDYLFTLSNLINKKFVLRSGGSIVWNGSPYDATIDLSAVYALKTSLGDLLSGTSSNLETNVKIPVECVLHLSDALSNPSVQFSIDFPSLDTQTRSLLQSLFSSQDEINKQVFSLMMMNKFYTPDYLDSDPSQQERSAGYQMGVTTASELLSNQLSRWLSQISSNLDIGFTYRPGDELTANEFEIALSTQLFNDRVTISANGNMQERAKSNSNAAITGDFDIDIKLNPQGTLRLKAYSHTDEKIIYNATETIQGIGISYQETFDTFRELWRKYISVFHRKKRSSPAD